MHLLSKESPLEISIAKMKAVLTDVGCQTTLSQEKHPLQNCYSIHLSSTEAPGHIYSNGKGVLSDASTASAFGEYVERLQTNNFFIDFHLPQRKYYPDEVAFAFGGAYLNEKLLQIYNPNEELVEDDLIDFNSDYEDKIVALPFINHSTKEKIYFPINILSNLYVSNGLATGNTPLESQTQALSEILERFVKIEIIKNAHALPNFPKELVESFPRVHADLLSLRELGYIVEVLDASLGGVFPVTAISLINPKNSTLFVSFGAHPILEVSLERTMTELMQGRDLENLDSFEVPTFDMSVISDNSNLESHFIDSNGKLGFGFLSAKKSFAYTPWRYDGTSAQTEHDFLVDIITKMDKDIYMREYNYLDFYSCQIIVPEISEIYPIDDLLYNNKNSGKLIRDMVLNFENYDPQEILANIESLDDSINMEKYIGVIFKNNFTMQEFKAHILLLLEEYEEAFERLELSQNKLGHVIVELARMEERELDFSDYENALYTIFGEVEVQKALRILDGDDFLIDVTLHQDYTNMLSMYDKLENKKTGRGNDLQRMV